MSDDINVAAFDGLIDTARAKFRDMLINDPSLFGGSENPRVAATISENAPRGTIAVPEGIDINTTQELMKHIDLTLLDRDAPQDAVKAIAERAKKESVASVCVYSDQVYLVQEVTDGNPPPIAVVGFPSVPGPGKKEMGATLNEMDIAIDDGAKEIDMVLPMNFKDGNPDYAAHYNYIRQVVKYAGECDMPVKVILETAYLTDEQKVEACMLAKMAGATFVKTSTGFAEEDLMRPELPKTQIGAIPHDVALMRRTVGDTTLTDTGEEIPMGVKASGRIRTRDQVIDLYQAGASRIGASGGIDVRSELEKQQDRSDAPRAVGGGRY